MTDANPVPPPPASPPPAPATPTVDARTLLQGGREVWLELDGTLYRLRVTRRNKLILQK